MNAATRAKIQKWIIEKSVKDNSLSPMPVSKTTTDKIVSSIPAARIASVCAQEAVEKAAGSKVSILTGDCRETLRSLPDASVHMCVTSPPYWGLRSYGTADLIWGGDKGCVHIWGDNNICQTCGAWKGSLGLEPTPELFTEHIVEVFREVRRVLRPDGVLFLNLGDSYYNYRPGAGSKQVRQSFSKEDGAVVEDVPRRGLKQEGLKEKDLVGIPWRVAFTLQLDGWYLRSDCIWAKGVSGQKDIWKNAYDAAIKEGLTEEAAKRVADAIDPYVGNCMPESVRDRPTRSHEYLFLLSKSPKYYYDNEAVKEEAVCDVRKRECSNGESTVDTKLRGHGSHRGTGLTRNLRSVWTIGTKPYRGAHFAVYPKELVRPCILAGCPKQVYSLCGAPWERVTEDAGMVRIREGSDTSGAAAQEGATGTHGDNSIFKTGMKKLVKTVGYKPSCSCNYAYPGCTVPEDDPAYMPYPSVPGTVLDCFGGSGTTGEVAREEGRNAVLCELNPEYVKLAEKRSGL